MRTLLSIGILAAAVAAAPNPIAAQEKAPAAGPSLVGGWTRNADLSDAPPGQGKQGDDSGQGRGSGSGGGRWPPPGRRWEAEAMAVAASAVAEAWAAAARRR